MVSWRIILPPSQSAECAGRTRDNTFTILKYSQAETADQRKVIAEHIAENGRVDLGSNNTSCGF
jgi:hypothetical protein